MRIERTGHLALALLAGVAVCESGQAQVCPPSLAFTSAPALPAGERPTSIVSEDFNGDGHFDIAVINWSSYDISVFLNDGTGGFGEESHFDPGAAPQHIAASDLDEDGILELATPIAFNQVAVLLGDGAGGFESPTHFDVGSSPKGIAAADFNADGHADLALANASSFDVSVLLGNGDGTFQPELNYEAAPLFSAREVDASDFNGDGAIDLAAVGQNNTMVILLNEGDGTFLPPQVHDVQGTPISLLVADLDGDGHDDLATTNTTGSNLSIFVGDGNGGFSHAMDVDGPAGLAASAAIDYDNDGDADLALAAGPLSGVVLLVNEGNLNFSTRASLPTSSRCNFILASDINGDGRADLAVPTDAGVKVFLNNCACPSDLDADGDTDVNDFFTYLDFFAAADPRADVTGDGSVDASDFFAFLDLFAAGCD